MARRFSWSGLMGRSTQDGAGDEDEDVEVVEFFSGAATSDATEKESLVPDIAPPKRKQRTDEAAERELRRQSEPPRPTQAATATGRGVPTSGEYVVAGDVSLLTPPTKRRRMLSQSITAMETLIEVIADEDEVLSTRLEYCSSLWRFVREMHAQDVVEFVRQRGSSVVRVIEALLHTGYFPLQQLCFMTVAAILYQLHKKDTEALAAFVVACKQYLNEADVNLLDLLPLAEAIPWHDPRVARHRIVQINRRTGLCNSFRASRCWVSPTGKQELARIRVNKWIDIGSTTTTFYWRDGNEVVVVNVPHSCVEDVEIEKENCILYIWTKHIDRLKGVRLLAFSSIPEDFPGLVKALVGVEIEGYVEPSQAPSPRDPIEVGSPIQTMRTTSTLVLTGPSPTRSPTTTVDESVAFDHLPVEDNAFEPDDDVESDTGVGAVTTAEPKIVVQEPAQTAHDEAAEPDGPDNAEFEPVEADSDISDDDGATESLPTEDIESADSIDSELDARLDRAKRRTSDSLESLHERLDANKEALTDTFSRVSSARLESSDAIGNRVYKLRARVDILQKKRLLDLSNAEGVAEDEISRAAAEANEHMEDTLDYAAENLIPDEPDFVFSTTSVVMLLVVVIPWVLFAALHSGTDFGSVRQLSNDAMVLLTALLRKFSG